MSESTRDTLSRVSSLALMAAILVVAAGISAITAMRLAIHGKEVPVPAVLGKSEQEAASILEASGLGLIVSSKRFSPGVPAGRVVDQNPPSGTPLKTTRSVRVLLSAGESRYAVPNLVGASRRAAQLTLAQRNFVLGHVSMARTPSGEPFTVQQQFPLPGSREATDPAVNVLLSAGPTFQQYVMPDLVGRRLEFVSSRMRAEGFQLGKLGFRKYTAVGPGIVTQQEPQAGRRLSKNDVITLEVSQ
jgi:serine/threonine-protein kinase